MRLFGGSVDCLDSPFSRSNFGPPKASGGEDLSRLILFYKTARYFWWRLSWVSMAFRGLAGT